MCLPVLAFVRKQNKEIEKSMVREPKKEGKKKSEWSKKRGAKGLFREVIWQEKAQIVFLLRGKCSLGFIWRNE